ncbi:TnsD family Tn7-like transposition protein [Bradyrhizobium embrapense]
MISLPKPYEDELLYSVFARALVYLGIRHDFAAARLVGRAHYSVFFGPPIDELGDMPSIWGMSPQGIVARHTMLPFYARFLPRRQLSKCLKLVEKGRRGNVVIHLGLQNQDNVIGPTHLKFCRSCALEDFARYGETFWRRSHQLNGTLVCLVHDEILRISNAAIGRRHGRPQDATAFVDLDVAPQCALLTPLEQSKARQVSGRCIDFLCGTPTPWGGGHLPSQYRQSAIALHYLEGSSNPKRLSHENLRRDFVEFYGSDLLSKLVCKLEGNRTWMERIFRRSSKNHFHPVFHALVQVFLEDSRQNQGRDLITKANTDVRDGWKCPNPYARHRKAFCVPVVDRRWRADSSIYFRGKCSCGYGFSFSSGTIRDPLVPETTRIWAWGTCWEREATRLKQTGLSMHKIAKLMNVSHHVVKRLIQKQKNKFETSDTDLLSLRTEWLQTRSKKAYQSLYHRDRAWLRAQPRRVSRGGVGHSKDWSALDITCAPRLRSALRTLKATTPPRRISYLALEEESGIKSLKIKLSRMPTCSAILAEIFKGTTK